MSEREIEELRRRKMAEMQRRLSEEQKVETQKQFALRRILTPEARQRLTNLKMIKPEFVSNLELQLIQLAQQGRVEIPISDSQLKQILIRLQANKRETKIRRV